MKRQETQTIKIRVATHNHLKVLAALRRQTMMEVLDALVQQDLQRVENEKETASKGK